MKLKVVTIERESREQRAVFVRAVDEDDELVDIDSLPVEVGFAAGDDRPTTWHAATWSSGGPFPSDVGLAYRAEFNVGGTGTAATIKLAVGTWRVWVRVTAASEKPVILAGRLTVH